MTKHTDEELLKCIYKVHIVNDKREP